MSKFLGVVCIMALSVVLAACAADTTARETPMGDGPATYVFLGESLSGTTGLTVYVDRVELEISLHGVAGTRVRSMGGTIEFREDDLGILTDPAWEYNRVCNGPDIACGDVTALMNDETTMPMVIESVTISKASDGTFAASLTGYVFTAGAPGEAVEIVGSGRMTGGCREVVDGTVIDLPITARPDCAAILADL